jgi:Na+-driven multidrug efflux pump
MTLSAGLAGSGLPQFSSLIASTSFAVTLVGDLVLIPNHGIEGAALASSIAYFVSGLFALTVYCRKTNSRVSDLLLLRRSDFSFLRAGLTRAHQVLRRSTELASDFSS